MANIHVRKFGLARCVDKVAPDVARRYRADAAYKTFQDNWSPWPKYSCVDLNRPICLPCEPGCQNSHDLDLSGTFSMITGLFLLSTIRTTAARHIILTFSGAIQMALDALVLSKDNTEWLLNYTHTFSRMTTLLSPV